MMNKKIYAILGLILLLLNVVPLTSAFDDVADVGRTDQPFSWMPVFLLDIYQPEYFKDIFVGSEDEEENDKPFDWMPVFPHDTYKPEYFKDILVDSEDEEENDKPFDWMPDYPHDTYQPEYFKDIFVGSEDEEDEETEEDEEEETEDEYIWNEDRLREDETDEETTEEDSETEDKIYSANLKFNRVFLDLNGEKLEVYVEIENNGNKKVSGVELRYHILETDILEIQSLGTIYPNKKSSILNYLNLEDLDKNKLTLMVEVIGNNGQYDVSYHNFELDNDNKEDNIVVIFNEIETTNEKPRGFFQRIIDWFVNQFKSL